jgi:glycine dehydrogenase subunit 1
VGETCMALAEHAKERVGLPLLFPERATFKEFAVRVGRPADEAIRAALELCVHPGYSFNSDYGGMEDALLVFLSDKKTPADVDRLAEVLGEVAGG